LDVGYPPPNSNVGREVIAMSEFECVRGHLMRPSSFYCEECAEEGRPNQRAVRMDGLSRCEAAMQEEWERDNPPLQEEEEEEEDQLE